MIKTFNINLAGQIFNINEDAYEHLSGYFNSLRTFYANEDDKDEINTACTGAKKTQEED